MTIEQAKNVASTFDKVCSAVLTQPNHLVNDVDFLGDRHKQKIAQWNQTALEKVDKCIHDIIQEQSVRRASHEAVCAWDGTFTHHDLDVITSRLAEHLIQLGVGPEVRVPLCFEKSVSHTPPLSLFNLIQDRNGPWWRCSPS